MARKGADWLPKRRSAPPRAKLKPWEPPEVAKRLAPDGDWDKIRYIVVDELHEGVAGLVVSPWPRIDARGRLVFGDEDESRRVATQAPVLLRDVDDRTAGKLRDRRLAIGDVFAARIEEPPGEPGFVFNDTATTENP